MLISQAITFENGKLQDKKRENEQDLEAEEQGTRRSQDEQGIELQDLTQSMDGGTALGTHPSDRFYTEYTAIDLDIVTSLGDLARTTTTSAAIDTENGAVSSVLSSVMARMVHRP